MTIRFILESAMKSEYDDSGFVLREMFTLEAEVPELEAQLTRGGYGCGAFHQIKVIGTEIVEKDRGEKDGE